MKSTADGYCLRNPKGKLIPETFDPDPDEAWSKAFDYLYIFQNAWIGGLWKKWDESVREAAKRRWVLIPVKLKKLPNTRRYTKRKADEETED